MFIEENEVNSEKNKARSKNKCLFVNSYREQRHEKLEDRKKLGYK